MTSDQARQRAESFKKEEREKTKRLKVLRLAKEAQAQNSNGDH